MISDSRAEKSMVYLAETDELAATLRADMERSEYVAKAKESAVFKIADGTVADRQAFAKTHPEVEAAYSEHFDAAKAYWAVANKRSTEGLVLEVWRTIQANRRHAGG